MAFVQPLLDLGDHDLHMLWKDIPTLESAFMKNFMRTNHGFASSQIKDCVANSTAAPDRRPRDHIRIHTSFELMLLLSVVGIHS
ncbi:reverse transcriptase from transposon X-element protein [Ceratobasidium theobromae]|uniref:Reverse transcriptase from transposon X-element protein n=1 Tax=Ceratobasidium theobromae TaxID=1582974 RepID=A0A5N5QCA5_9AGAM|nr:reverse transcriptase from transposon X-element protein [Ceratobasidium theobromae]